MANKTQSVQSITIDRDALLAAVASIAAVVERRNTIPILSNMLVEAVDGRLTLRATDLDMEARTTLPAEGADLLTTIPAGLLHDLLRKLPEGASVGFQPGINPDTLVLRSGRSRFTLQTLAASDFPDMTIGEFTHGFDLPAATLTRMMKTVRFAISTEETRYYLNGIYLHVAEAEAGATLTMVATDGHRLARDRADAPAGAGGMPGVIIPRKTVEQILKDLAGAGKEEVVHIDVSTAKIRYVSPRLSLVSKLIDGTFPDYTRVIPVANDKRLVVDKDALSTAADRVGTISSERGRAVKVSVEPGKLTLSVNNPDSGNAVEELEAEYDSGPIEIGFNTKYLADMLGAIDADTITVMLADPSSPTLFQSREGAPALFVLMPMRV